MKQLSFGSKRSWLKNVLRIQCISDFCHRGRSDCRQKQMVDRIVHDRISLIMRKFRAYSEEGDSPKNGGIESIRPRQGDLILPMRWKVMVVASNCREPQFDLGVESATKTMVTGWDTSALITLERGWMLGSPRCEMTTGGYFRWYKVGWSRGAVFEHEGKQTALIGHAEGYLIAGQSQFPELLIFPFSRGLCHCKADSDDPGGDWLGEQQFRIGASGTPTGLCAGSGKEFDRAAVGLCRSASVFLISLISV